MAAAKSTVAMRAGLYLWTLAVHTDLRWFACGVESFVEEVSCR
jgi:hypothetical protein